MTNVSTKIHAQAVVLILSASTKDMQDVLVHSYPVGGTTEQIILHQKI